MHSSCAYKFTRNSSSVKINASLYKSSTSLTISLIGIILILLTIGVVGYIIVTDVTNSVSTTVNSGSAYDNLTQLKSDYNNLSQKYSALNEQLGTHAENNVKTNYNEGKLKLSELNETINSIESDINKGASDKIISSEINQAKEDIKEAEEVYNNITASK